jgi:zinc transport system permease protein
MDTDLAIQLIGAAAVGLGAGVLGALMILRRMALVGDALSHVALPGIAVALIVGFDPFVGAFAALAFAVIGVWLLERHTGLPSETLVGIFFTTALAVGLLITPEPELLEALFGDVTAMTTTGMIISVIAAAVVIPIIWRIGGRVVASTISLELTRASGLRPGRSDLIFFALVALIVALGIKVAGTLLTGALVIIPAATFKGIAGSLRSYLIGSGLLGLLSAVAGILAARALDVPPGPTIVLAAGVLFVVTLPFRRN